MGLCRPGRFLLSVSVCSSAGCQISAVASLIWAGGGDRRKNESQETRPTIHRSEPLLKPPPPSFKESPDSLLSKSMRTDQFYPSVDKQCHFSRARASAEGCASVPQDPARQCLTDAP